MFPTAAGIGNIASTAMRYVPQLWSPKLLVKFYQTCVIGAISNTDYEGQIKQQGDTVYIRSRPTMTINTYVKGQGLTYETLTSTATSLAIDQGRSWSFVENAVDAKQTDLKNHISEWIDDGSKQLAINIDTAVLGAIYADAHASNRGITAGAISGNIDLGVASGAGVALTASTILTKMVQCAQVLKEQNVPQQTPMWFVLPEWAISLLALSDIKNASLTGDMVSPMRNGKIGQVYRFNVYSSNLLATAAETSGPAATCTYALFGTNDALTFASQLTENESLKNPTDFGMLYRGLQVFGYSVVKPEALGVLFCKEG